MDTGEKLKKLRIDRSRKAPRRRSSNTGCWIFVLALLGAAGYVFKEPITVWIDSVRLPTVKTTRVSRSSEVRVSAVQGLAANGYIVAARRAALSADTPGRIVEINVREGSKVATGDLVARLYDREFAAAVKRSEAELLAARARVVAAEASVNASKSDVEQAKASVLAAEQARLADQADLTLAEKELKRLQELFEKAAANQSQLDSAIAAVNRTKARLARGAALISAAKTAVQNAAARIKVAEAELKVAKAQVGVNQAILQQSRATLKKTEVRAPFDGVVVLKDAELGEVVSPNVQSGGSSRGSVVTMVDFNSLEVQADVPESSLSRVKIGSPVKIFLDAYPENAYAGKVDRVWPTADRQKATVEVRAVFEKRDDKLRPEMGVRLVFVTKSDDKTENNADKPESTGSKADKSDSEPPILISSQCLVVENGQNYVFLLERDVVKLTKIELGEQKSDQVVVKAGLSVGSIIVINPEPRLKDGDRVQVDNS